MLFQTFWYQTFENRIKIKLSGQYSLNYSCKCKPTFGTPCITHFSSDSYTGITLMDQINVLGVILSSNCLFKNQINQSRDC